MATGVTLYVLEQGGNFKFSTFYEQVNSVYDDAFLTHDGNPYLSTMFNLGNYALAGFLKLSDDGEAVVDAHALMTGQFGGDPAVTVGDGLASAVQTGTSGTEAIVQAFAADDRLLGNTHNDVLRGFAGVDYLAGYDGNDVLNGDAGNDYLLGERGNDTMTGGAGHDIFGFRDIVEGKPGGWGRDTITDFKQGDKISFFAAEQVHKIKDLTITQAGKDTVIKDSQGDTITLIGIDAKSISAKDFYFDPAASGPDIMSGGSHHPWTGGGHDLGLHLILA